MNIFTPIKSHMGGRVKDFLGRSFFVLGNPGVSFIPYHPFNCPYDALLSLLQSVALSPDCRA